MDPVFVSAAGGNGMVMGTPHVGILPPAGLQEDDFLVGGLWVPVGTITPDEEWAVGPWASPGAGAFLYTFTRRAGASEPGVYGFATSNIGILWAGAILAYRFVGRLLDADAQANGSTFTHQTPSIQAKMRGPVVGFYAGSVVGNTFTSAAGMSARLHKSPSFDALDLFAASSGPTGSLPATTGVATVSATALLSLAPEGLPDGIFRRAFGGGMG